MAAITRPEKRCFSWLPTALKVRSCRTWSSLVWIGIVTSPISSRKIAPCGLQRAKTPSWWSIAPVNAPLRWPNSSDSISVSGYCERLMATKPRAKLTTKAPRRSSKGMKPERPRAIAAAPLPVPVSPSSSVEKSSIRFQR